MKGVFHYITDDLVFADEYACRGIRELERLLAKHAEFVRLFGA